MKHSFLGPGFEEAGIRKLLDDRGIPFTEPGDQAVEAASLLAKGETVGRFAGRMEWGPRALGNRSILAHPAKPGTADRVNRAVKFREPWRPFCPAVLSSSSSEICDGPPESPFMTVNYRVRPEWRNRIPEVVHRDGTARIQTVDEARAPGFHTLLKAFEKITGLPVLMNTSLNRRGEPIACTPEDALEVFFGSGLEHLMLGPFLISKASLGSGEGA
jgi:carbamoyltransferase